MFKTKFKRHQTLRRWTPKTVYTITCCERFEHNQVRIQGSNLDSSTSNEYLCVMRKFFIPAQCSSYH